MIKKIKIGIIIFIILVFSIICFLLFKKKQSGSEEQISSLPVSYKEEVKETNQQELTQEQAQEKEKITEITENQGLQGDENIYEITTEYDGREVVTIKSNIKFKTALAGMIKKQIPEFSEIDTLLEQAPTHTGIWIEESSRENFLKIVNNITNSNYKIDDKGFLVQNNIAWNKNQYDKGINQMLSDKILYIFAFSSTTYIVNEVTGEIQEYPFEEMDPYTEYEYFESDDKAMFIISENLRGKILQEEILKKVFLGTEEKSIT